MVSSGSDTDLYVKKGAAVTNIVDNHCMSATGMDESCVVSVDSLITDAQQEVYIGAYCYNPGQNAACLFRLNVEYEQPQANYPCSNDCPAPIPQVVPYATHPTAHVKLLSYFVQVSASTSVHWLCGG